MSQCLSSVKCVVELHKIEQVVHVDSHEFVLQTLSEPDNSTSCWWKLQVFELRSQCRRWPMMKPNWICVPTIANCITLKPISFSLVGDVELHRQSSLKADGLFIDGDPLPRNPHVLRLLIQLGGPAQKRSFFQMVTKLFLSVLIYSTTCEYDILKVF